MNKFRRLTAALLAAAMVILLQGCANAHLRVYERTSFLFDTIITIKVWCDSDASHILDGAISLCAEYDRLLDRHDPESDIGRINGAEGMPCEVSEDTAELLSLALEYSRLSGGRFDPTCGRVTSLWNFSTETPALPAADELASALATVGWEAVELEGRTVRLPAGTQLDLGGIAKGYIADRTVEYLRRQGIESAVVNLGGNVRVLGDKDGQPFSVGIQSPFEEDGYAGVLCVSDCSVVTAGSYQRSFELNGSLYHHILDLTDGMPADTGLASVTVVTESSADADALATICFLLGPEEGRALLESIGAHGYFVASDGQMMTTTGAEGLLRAD